MSNQRFPYLQVRRLLNSFIVWSSCLAQGGWHAIFPFAFQQSNDFDIDNNRFQKAQSSSSICIAIGYSHFSVLAWYPRTSVLKVVIGYTPVN
jgi:hypothetical protein